MLSLGRNSLIALAVIVAVALSGAMTPVLACACLGHVGPACCKDQHDAVVQPKNAASECCTESNGAAPPESCEGQAELASLITGKTCGCLHNAPVGRIPAPQQEFKPSSGPSGENSLVPILQMVPVQFFQAAEHSPPVLTRQENPKYLSQCALLL